MRRFSGIFLANLSAILAQFVIIFQCSRMGYIDASASIALALGIGTPILVLLISQISSLYITNKNYLLPDFTKHRSTGIVAYSFIILAIFLMSDLNITFLIYLFLRTGDMIFDYVNTIIIKSQREEEFYFISIYRFTAVVVPYMLSLHFGGNVNVALLISCFSIIIYILINERKDALPLLNPLKEIRVLRIFEGLQFIVKYGAPLLISSLLPNLLRIVLANKGNEVNLVAYSNIFMIINGISIVTGSFIQSRLVMLGGIDSQNFWRKILYLSWIPAFISIFIIFPIFLYPDFLNNLVFGNKDDMIGIDSAIFAIFLYVLFSVLLYSINVTYVHLQLPRFQLFSSMLGVVCGIVFLLTLLWRYNSLNVHHAFYTLCISIIFQVVLGVFLIFSSLRRR